MPSVKRIHHHRVVNAPIEVVFDMVADHARFAEWSMARQATIESIGSPHPNGVGAVRRVGAGPIAVREEVTAFDPPHVFAYRIVSLPGTRDYHAVVSLEPLDEDRTDVHWTAEFLGRGIGGVLAHAAFNLFLRDLLRRVERRAPGWKPVTE